MVGLDSFDKKKLSEKLYHDILDDSKKSYDVVVTVSDEIDEITLAAANPISINAAMSIDKNKKVVYELNRQTSSLDEIQHHSQQIKYELDYLEEARKETAKKNLLKMQKSLKTQNESFKKSMEKNGRSFEITMTKSELLEFAKDAQESIKHIGYKPNILAGGVSEALIDMFIANADTSYNTPNMGNSVSTIVGDTGVGIGSFVGGTFTRYNTNDNVEDRHASKTARLVRLAAPYTPIYAFNAPTSSFDIGEAGDSASINSLISTLQYSSAPVLVESYSVMGSGFNSTYQAIDQLYDNHIYQKRINAAICSGNLEDYNPSCYVSSPGKAMNAITVGWYDDATDTIHQNSCGGNTAIGHQKPEVVAPGVGFSIQGANGTVYGTKPDNGCSFATPLVAGFIADTLSDTAFLKDSPAATKALMLAGATDSISGNAGKVGVGGVDYNGTSIHRTNLMYLYDNNGNGPFSSSGYSCYTGFSMYRYSSESAVRVAISWLNRGDYIISNNKAGMNFDLEVLDPSGNSVGSSSSMNNPYELVQFNPSVTGNYTIRVCRVSKDDTNARLDLGVAVVAY